MSSPPRILIVRTSSLGDVVHTLPAISDIARRYPGARIDWLVEEAFAEIPAWHPAVAQVIPVAQRRWRKAWWRASVRAERAALTARLRRDAYDLVLDAQGLLKSAWLARQVPGTRHGLDWYSAREPLASLCYQVKHRVDFDQPAVTRQRLLAALALGGAALDLLADAPDYGLQALCAAGQTRAANVPPYAVVVASASRDDKLWPEADWRAVLTALVERGLHLQLLAGNAAETARAQALVAGCAPLAERATVLPRMTLTEVAHRLAAARLTVGLDSGLTHLSAALGKPTVAIYCASSPLRTPLVGSAYTASLGAPGAPPARAAVQEAVAQTLATDTNLGSSTPRHHTRERPG